MREICLGGRYFMHGALIVDGHLLGDEILVGFVLDDGSHL